MRSFRKQDEARHSVGDKCLNVSIFPLTCSRMFSFFENFIDPFKPNKRTELPRNSTIRFILFFVKQAPYIFLAVLVFGGLQAWIEITLFGFIGSIVDLLQSSTPEAIVKDYWFTFVWMIFFIGVIRVVVLAIATMLVELSVLPSIYNMIRWQTHKNVSRQSLSFFQNDFAGRIATKVIQAGSSATEFMTALLDTVWLIVLYLISTMILFLGLDWRLTASLGVWLVVYTAILIMFVPRVRERARVMADAKSIFTGRLVDSYSNIALVKTDSAPEREDAFVATGMSRLIGAARGFGRTLVKLRVGVVVVNSLMLVAVGYISLSQWMLNTLTIGEVAFVFGLVLRLNLLANRFLSQINGLFRNYGQVQDAMNTVAQPVELVDAPNAATLQVSQATIEFKSVSFNYHQFTSDESRISVIENLDLQIGSGEKIGLVGPSGAGKSTIVNLLMRMYDLDSGSIEIDGQNICEVTQDSLRRNIGFVSQDTALLHRSVRDNISYPRPDASDADILAAATRARALEFIDELKDNKGRTGLAAHVGERGVKLSGGQRQRIAIARVLLKDAPILVLDEATSALDSEVEAEIQSSLQELMHGKTVIAIAHRLSTIAAMDRLVVIDAGRVVESGTHKKLLANGGRYASLWKRQSGGFLSLP
jgi:ATP-binding cassette subfamily B multidrug efflux pump